MNSGSSFDGIDVILAEIEMDGDGFPKAPRFICGGSYDWPEEVTPIVRDAFENRVDMVGINRLNYICGAVFAEKAVQFMEENHINPLDIKVLGLDTQTIYQEHLTTRRSRPCQKKKRGTGFTDGWTDRIRPDFRWERAL